MKRTISVTTGTRADYGLLRPVLEEIRSSKNLDLFLIVTGTHLSKKYGLTINEIKKDRFNIDAKINMIPKQDDLFSMSVELGKGIISFSNLFKKMRPDINLILGDRDEMLASALAASHMNIPNAHIHGGEKSGGIDEYTRHAITKISNIHFAVTEKSQKRIIKMGENPSNVFFTGSPGIDDIFKNKISTKKFLNKKYGLELKGDEIILLQHPVTTETLSAEKQILNILNAILKTKKNIIAIAPNSDAGNKKIFLHLKKFSKKYSFFNLYDSIPRSDYLGFLKNCGVLIGNSSSGLIESSYFHIPVINIGIRQKNRERGKNVIDVDGNSTIVIYNTVLKALKLHKSQKIKSNFIYGTGNTSKLIVKYLERIKLDKKLIQKELFY